MSKSLKVAVLLPIESTFDYSIPDDKELTRNIIGKRVIVHFGSRYVTGVVLEINEHPSVDELKPIIEILDEHPIFDSNMLKLAKWISNYYICSLGEVLRAAMPPNFNLNSIKEIEILREPTHEEIIQMHKRAPKRSKLLQLLIRTNGKISIKSIEKELDLRNISPQLEALEQKGFIQVHESMETQIETKILALSINTEFESDEEKLLSYFDKYEKRFPKRTQVVSFLITEKQNGRAFVPQNEVVGLFKIATSTLKSMIEEGIILQSKINKPRTAKNEKSLAGNETHHQLTEEQSRVFQSIMQSVNNGGFSSHLIFGVTGSGKTLVYAKLINEVINQGKNVLYLLPEISLTPQLVDRVQSFFNHKVAVLHSQLSDNERNQIFRKIQQGEYRICMGVRSGVFAPIPNLGLIIVDEEHDQSYKQESPAPRYNARDTAIVRAKIQGIPIVLGSGTPSLESWNNAKSGLYNFHTILNRADGAILPEITIVDMATERKEKRLKKYFSEKLLDNIVERVKKKEGVILFHNRRGYSPQLFCPDCGNVPMCPNCDVSLTYHKHNNKLICHYCGFVAESPKICNICGSDDIKQLGYGTERLEEDLAEVLKEYGIEPVIKRFDRDTTSRKNAYRNLIHRFIEGDIDILVGTQMLSKGINIQRVSLVGIVDADMHLFFPDFRANERAFQLFTQTAGRAGRKSDYPGNVIIQTSNPNHSVIRYIKDYSIQLFYEDELAMRRQFKYPPIARFTKLQFNSEDFDSAMLGAEYFHKLLPKYKSGFIISKPVIPGIARIRNYFRIQLFIKSSKKLDSSGDMLQQLLKKAINSFQQVEISKKVRITIDIDSYSNM